ncbi:MAG: hypothetical protein AAGC56_08410, partial [Pseudomonadota bacterium]
MNKFEIAAVAAFLSVSPVVAAHASPMSGGSWSVSESSTDVEEHDGSALLRFIAWIGLDFRGSEAAPKPHAPAEPCADDASAQGTLETASAGGDAVA